MKRFTFIFIAVVVIAALTNFITVQAEAVPWLNLNVAPFNPEGDLKVDLEGPAEFAKYGLLTEQQVEELIILIKNNKFERVVLQRGRPLRAMLSRNKGKVHADTAGVDPQWRNIVSVDARLYRSGGIEYMIVDQCGNPVLADPIPVQVVREYAQSGPDAVRTWRLNLWSWENSSPEGRDVLSQMWNGVKGRQSIDLSDQIMEAAAAGKILPYVKTNEPFKFEWFDIDEEIYLRDTIWVTANEQGTAKRVEIHPLSTSQGLYASEGNATLTIRISPVWAKPDMSYAVTATQGLHLRYPKGHVLFSCGKATANMTPQGCLSPTISYRHAQRAGITDLHFVVY
jgi:hypothetical protein